MTKIVNYLDCFNRHVPMTPLNARDSKRPMMAPAIPFDATHPRRQQIALLVFALAG